jgi:hypothetical protein
MITITNPLRIGDVQRYYVRSGEPVCDVSTSEGGYYIAVPVRCYGQGSLFPLKKGDRAHLYFPDGRDDLPYIVGIDYSGSLPTSSSDPGTSSDYSPSLEDATVTSGGSRLSLGQYGITLEPSGSVRVQLGEGQVFRISVEGDSEDNALRGQDFIDALFPLLSSFELRLAALEAWVLPASTAVQAKLNVPSPGAGVETPIVVADLATPYIPQPTIPTADTTKASCEGTKSDAVKIQ